MAGAVRLHGLRELQRSLQRVNRAAAKTVRDALKESVEPAVASTKAKEGRWAGASVGTIGARATNRSVFVTQRARKVTGRRPDFGSLQMREALIPSVWENVNEITRGVERAFDRLLRRERL